MTTETTTTELTVEELEALKGASVQIHHDATDMGTHNLHMWAGKHGTLQGVTPFGAALISVGNATKQFDRDQFSITAGPGTAPAIAPGAVPQSATAPGAAIQLLNLPPLQAINSPTNPRRRRGLDLESLRTLADSISTHGLAQPILVRPLPAARLEETTDMDPRPAYEVVAGERRWRAAQLAELATMPMLVRDLDDGAVLEMQLVENIEREDMDPMEEAEGFALLREKLGYTVEQIAEKMGKGRGPSYVRKRMKLLDLSPDSREAMYDGTLVLSTGLLVSRYPAAQQAQAVKVIRKMQGQGPGGEVLHAPVREVMRQLFAKLHLVLRQAPFDQDDPVLVLAAGPCSTCPKRTGTNADLFGEADQGADPSCTDADCWGQKKAAHAARAVADAQARGLKVMDEAEAAKLLPSPHSRYMEGFVPVTETAYTVDGEDDTERNVTYADALRGMGRKAPKPTLVVHPHTGQVYEVIPDELAAKLEAAGEKAAQAGAGTGTPAAGGTVGQRPPHVPEVPLTPEQAKVRALRRQDVMRAIMFRLFDAVRTRERTTDELRLIAEQFIAHDDEHEYGFLEQYMDWDSQQDGDPAAYLREKLAALDAQQLAQVITMAAMEGALNLYGGRYEDEDDALAYVQAQGIDVLAVRDKVDEDLQRQQDAADDEDPDADADADAEEQEGGAA